MHRGALDGGPRSALQKHRHNSAKRGFAQKVGNPPHGSAGIVQIEPARARFEKYPNPTNGSWWIVQSDLSVGCDDGKSNFA
jgi:hypothetical protein